jgi:hypothetical protein
MCVIAQGEGDVLTNPENYAIGAFVGDECRGAAKMVGDKWFITIHGEFSDAVTLRLYNKVTGKYSDLSVDGKASMSFTSLAGTLRNPVKLVNSATTGISSAVYGNLSVYADGNQLHVDGVGNAKVTIFDMGGKTVYGGVVSDGVIDISNLTKGVYMMKISAEEGTICKKFMK